jgi:hypothetical protein
MTMSSCAGTHAMAMRQPLSFDGVHDFLDTLFGDDLHAKRVKSLAGATLGAIQSASLAVGLIGQGLALARGRLAKHAVKQVDRLLSNRGIDVDALLVHWVPYVVGQRDSITVAMDWTEFDADGQATSSSAFAATSRSLPPMARRAQPPIGLAPAVAREPCAVPRSPPRRIRSPPWSACGRKA